VLPDLYGRGRFITWAAVVVGVGLLAALFWPVKRRPETIRGTTR
jgi:hypothetical protein